MHRFLAALFIMTILFAMLRASAMDSYPGHGYRAMKNEAAKTKPYRQFHLNTDVISSESVSTSPEVSGSTDSIIPGTIAIDLLNYYRESMAKSRGIYFRFEAEYHDDSDVHPGGDLSGTMVYMSPSENSARVGYPNIDEDSSNHHFWQIENGIAGYAYRDIQFKNQVLASDSYPHAGREFLFPLNNAGSEYQHNSNKLHVTFALRCYLLEDLPDTTVIAIISFKSGDVINNKQNLIPHYTSETDSTEFTYLTKAMYQAAPIDAVHQNRLVSVSIPVKSLYYRNAVRYTREGLLPMVNLNPNLYWKGMGVLKLDYIDYRDDWYKKYKYRDALQQ